MENTAFKEKHHKEILTSVPCPLQPCNHSAPTRNQLFMSISLCLRKSTTVLLKSEQRLQLFVPIRGLLLKYKFFWVSWPSGFSGKVIWSFLLPVWKCKVPLAEDTLFFIFSSQLLLPRVLSCVRDFTWCSAIRHYQYRMTKPLTCTFAEYIRSKPNSGNSWILIFLQISAPQSWWEKPESQQCMIWGTEGR